MAEEDAKENLERLKAIRAAHRGVITKKVQQAIVKYWVTKKIR